MEVEYSWYGSPRQDFTVKIYSVHDGASITDADGNTNMMHNDGQEPSEFVYIAENFSR